MNSPAGQESDQTGEVRQFFRNLRSNLAMAFLSAGVATKCLSAAALHPAVAVEWMLVNVPVS